MRSRLVFALACVAVVAVVTGGCGARTGLLVPPPPPLSVSGKVDLLFMIDNSGSMGDKQQLLGEAIPDLLNRLINPMCLDGSGNVLSESIKGACAAGTLEFKPVPDIHIAIVTSSLGDLGGDVCPPDSPNPIDPALLRHFDDQGLLINRTADADAPLPQALPSNFLAWFPSVTANRGNPTPPVTPITDPNQLVALFQDLVDGIGQYGCGLEAQMEAWYRFLVQPDPYASVVVGSDNRAGFVGVDEVILQQRHDFLRPDSLLGVIVVTDEDDSQVDPQAFGGNAWFFYNSTYPGSPTTAPPRPTSICATSPLDPGCMPCTQAPPGDPNCDINGGFLQDTDDPINVRNVHFKQQVGIDPQYPVQRYIDALTSPMVPDRNGEHPNGSPTYVGEKDCVNPIFAQNLPTSSSDELCNLQPGPRSTDLVYFSLIGGVPHQLLQQDPTNPDSPQKTTLTPADWLTILGTDPLSYDFTGEDPHMLESNQPRPGLPPPSAPNNADPISGREWTTGNSFLEYACIFPLPTPHDCTAPEYAPFCDCRPGMATPPPLCDLTTPTLQLFGKAYPTIRELVVAHSLGARATISSLCPIHMTETEPNDPLYAYRPAVAGIVDAFRSGLVH